MWGVLTAFPNSGSTRSEEGYLVVNNTMNYCNYEVIPNAMRHTVIDPAYQQVSRLALLGLGDVIIANGPFLYRLQLEDIDAETLDEAEGTVTESKVKQRSSLVRMASKLCFDTGGQHALQSIKADSSRNIIYGTDCSGMVWIHSANDICSHGGATVASDGWVNGKAGDYGLSSCIINSQSSANGFGWSGLSVEGTSLCAVHTTTQSVTFCDVERGTVINRERCTGSPTAIGSLVQEKTGMPVHIVGEQGFLSVWDSRLSSPSSCTGRYTLNTRETILTCSAKSSYEVHAAGAEKQIYTFDLRKQRVVSMYRTAAKFPILSLLASPTAQHDHVYVAGHDNELMRVEPNPSPTNHNQSDSKKRDLNGNTLTDTSEKLHLTYNRGVRSRAHWLGMDITSEGITSSACDSDDRIMGVCASGNLYAVKRANRMALAQFNSDGEGM